MNIINIIFLFIITESLFNTDVYSLKNIFGSLAYIIFNLFIVLAGSYQLIKSSGLIKMTFLLFCFISFLSAIINQTSIFDFIEFIMRYGKIYFATIIGISISKKISQKELIQSILTINAINFILNLFFFFNIPILPNKWIGTLDFATGILGDALYQCLFSYIVFILSLLLFRSRSFRPDILYFSILSSAIQIFWSNSFHFFVVLFIAFLLSILFIKSFVSFLRIIGPIIATIIFINSLSSSQFFTNSFITLANTSPKVASYRDTFSNEYQTNIQQVIGVGPGQGGSYIALRNQTNVAENYFGIYDYFTDKLRHGSITTLPNTGITTLKSELGYLGLISFFIFLLALIYLLRFSIYQNRSEFKVLSLSLIFVFLMENILADYLQHSLFPILIFLIVGYSIGDKK